MSLKTNLELTNNTYHKLLLVKKNKWFYTHIQRDTLIVGAKKMVKKGEKYNGDILLISSKKTGEKEIEKVVGHFYSEEGMNLYSLKKSPKGNIYVHGRFRNGLGLNKDWLILPNDSTKVGGIFIAKFDKKGNSLWTKIIEEESCFNYYVYLNNWIIDSKENACFSFKKRAECQLVYDSKTQLGVLNTESHILFQIDKNGVLTWKNEYFEKEYEDKVIDKTFDSKDNLWTIKRQRFENPGDRYMTVKEEGTEKQMLRSTGYLSSILKDGKTHVDYYLKTIAFPLEMYPSKNGFFILSRDLPAEFGSRYDCPEGTKEEVKELNLKYDSHCRFIVFSDKKGNEIWNSFGFNTYRGYQYKSLISNHLKSGDDKRHFTLIAEHERRGVYTHTPIILEVVKFDKKNGERKSHILLIENVKIAKHFIHEKHLIIYGSSNFSSLKINGDKIPIDNPNFSPTESNSNQRLTHLSNIILKLKI
jgi:hypothetical protein